MLLMASIDANSVVAEGRGGISVRFSGSGIFSLDSSHFLARSGAVRDIQARAICEGV